MSLSKNYARALFETAKEARLSAEQIASLESELRSVADVIRESSELRNALLGPVGSKGEKESVLQAVASKLGVSAIANRFLALLVRKGRLELLSSLPSELVSIRVEAAGGVLGTVETAEELDGAAYEEISRAFSRKLGKSITLVPRVDADLLAGLRVTVQGVTYDGTLRGQLSRLGAELLFVNEADGVKA